MSIPDPRNSREPPSDPAVPDGSSAHTLFPAAYERLRALAQLFIRAERSKRLLQATALVHEAYVRLCVADRAFENESEFLAIAAAQMRRVLVDYARRERAAKRGAGREPVTLDSQLLADSAASRPLGLLEVDDAISRLTSLDQRQGRIAELHLFGSLTVEEVAPMLGVSARTAFNDWRVARAWLLKELAP